MSSVKIIYCLSVLFAKSIPHSMKSLFTSLFLSAILVSCSPKLSNLKENNQMKEQLTEMNKSDQIAAKMPTGKYLAYTNERWQGFKDSVFTANKFLAEGMFKKFGFPGFDRVGNEGSSHFWLVVQHCDKFPDFQKIVLKSMRKAVKRKNANPNDYAYLYDRVKVNANEKQLFGTQVTYEIQTTGRAIPKIGLVDSANVDKLRSQYKLEPLKDYLDKMTTLHFEMNKPYYQKMGLEKPSLY